MTFYIENRVSRNFSIFFSAICTKRTKKHKPCRNRQKMAYFKFLRKFGKNLVFEDRPILTLLVLEQRQIGIVRDVVMFCAEIS